ncbi:MAG: phage tail protein [Desulfovibrio sp.]
MADFYAILTKVGAAALSNAFTMGRSVDLTQMAVGDGNGADVVVTEAQTALVNEVYKADLNSLQLDGKNSAAICAELVIPADVGGWTMREIGLFTAAGDLFAVAAVPASYKPELSEGAAAEVCMRMIITASHLNSIELKIDPTVVLATIAELEKRINDHDADSEAHSELLTSLVAGLPDKNHTHAEYLGKTETAVNAEKLGSVKVQVDELDVDNPIMLVGGFGWGKKAPNGATLFAEDFNTFVLRDCVVTVSGDWANGPTPIGGYAGLLFNFDRAFENYTHQQFVVKEQTFLEPDTPKLVCGMSGGLSLILETMGTIAALMRICWTVFMEANTGH